MNGNGAASQLNQIIFCQNVLTYRKNIDGHCPKLQTLAATHAYCEPTILHAELIEPIAFTICTLDPAYLAAPAGSDENNQFFSATTNTIAEASSICIDSIYAIAGRCL
jgi:hypothetical protein